VRRIVQRKQFRDDLKRQKRRGKDLRDLFEAVELLAEQATLPPAYHAHRLTAEWSGYSECHIEADWLLIYTTTDDEVLLIRTGTHDDLFS
jgi:mRNA interferase YafQ